MSEIDLSKIKVIIADRKLMKSSKSWRIFFNLPSHKDNPMLAPILAGMIEAKIRMVLRMSGGMILDIDPMFICDVPTKGRNFQLVLETCYEYQVAKYKVGEKLTMALHEDAILEIHPSSGKVPHAVGLQPPPAVEAPSETKRGSITDKSLKGLHVLFGNPRFQEYVATTCLRHFSEEVSQEKDAVKIAFKMLCGVESCVELEEETVQGYLRDFNRWLNGAAMEGNANGGKA